MVDVDPELWKNKTLGAAANGPFLDEETQQALENANAAREGRTPRQLDKAKRWPLIDPSAEPNPPSGGHPLTFMEVKHESPKARK